jgi:hypothetical protein
MKADDGLLLPILQSEIAGNRAVVLVHLPVAFPPVVELTDVDVEPPDEPPGADLVRSRIAWKCSRRRNLGALAVSALRRVRE